MVILMSVLLETSIGEIVIDLFCDEAPLACQNFLKLCKLKYYNNTLVHSVEKNHLAQFGDPTVGLSKAGSVVAENIKLPCSVFGIVTKDPAKRYFDDQISQTRKFKGKGLVATANLGPNLNTSTFFVTLTDDELPSLFKKHTIFGQVEEGLDVLEKLNSVYTH